MVKLFKYYPRVTKKAIITKGLAFWFKGIGSHLTSAERLALYICMYVYDPRSPS